MRKRVRARGFFVSGARCRSARSARPARWVGSAVAVAVWLSCALLVFTAPHAAWATGAFKRTPGTQKDAFIVQGEIIFVGGADYWESTYDPENDAPYNGLVDGAPATDAAREHLYNLDVELAALAVLQVEVSSAATGGGVTTHTVSSTEIRMGQLAFSNFTSAELETAVGDTGPFSYTVVGTACSGYTLIGCDWVWGQALSPTGISPDDTDLQFDSAVQPSGAQHGLNFHYGGDIYTLPANSGAVETTFVTTPSYIMIDLLVPDLPTTWTFHYGNNVRVAAQVTDGLYYYAVYVPAMDRAGGAVLVLLVLAGGLLVLCCPAGQGFVRSRRGRGLT